ncbi:MAG TPA: CapA family protein [Candidatus Paceibacterota bacterium]|nr:CapA family protein [Candidatus Paceibacterota bacterium]
MNRRTFLKEMRNLTGLALFDQQINQINNNLCLKISGAGDVTLAYRFNEMFQNLERNIGEQEAFKFPFINVKDYFISSDISIVNFEGTLTNYGVKMPKKFNFKGNPKYAQCLTMANIEIVNVANNHIKDYCETGTRDTLEALEECNIIYCGGGKNIDDAKTPRTISKKGLDVSFLGYAKVGSSFCAGKNSAGTNPFIRDSTFSEIEEAKKYSDILVVSCHWGVERSAFPSGAEISDAKRMIDSGADVVFGHHPHVLQGIQKYNGGLICWSLGNFVFGGNTFPSDRDSMIVQTNFSGNKLIDYSTIPVITHPKSMVFQPYVPEDRERILNKIEYRSNIG